MTGKILFGVIALLSVVSAILVVTHRNPIRAALSLVVNFVCLAVLYVMLNAQVLAALQILVYAGAIMVLFLFVIMLLNLGGENAKTNPLVGQTFTALVLSTAMLVGLTFAVDYFVKNPMETSAGLLRAEAAGQQGIPQVQVIGYDMFTRYVYPFELTSVLLLVGVVGVLVLTKRRAGAATTEMVTENAGRN